MEKRTRYERGGIAQAASFAHMEHEMNAEGSNHEQIFCSRRFLSSRCSLQPCLDCWNFHLSLNGVLASMRLAQFGGVAMDVKVRSKS